MMKTSILTLEGADARTFAQAQFTSDVRTLDVGHWQWSAWLDARGRVQSIFHLARTGEDTLTILLRGGEASEMVDRLQRFVFRSRLTLTAQPASCIGGGTALPAFAANMQEGALTLGLGDRSLLFPCSDEDDAWRLQAIRHGEPWLGNGFPGTLLPPALSLRRLGALSLDKGCFPGQEIAARLHYLGGHKYALVHLQSDRPLPPGADAVDAGPRDENAEAPPIRVLDCMPANGAYEALAVVHERELPRLRESTDQAGQAPVLLQRFEP